MKFPPEHYFESASERIRQARYVYQEEKSFALAIYLGGLAVECMLRAYKGRRDATFDERHDLLRLFAASGMLTVDVNVLSAQGWSDSRIDEHQRALRNAVNEIYRVWSNNYRFASESRLRSHLKKLARDSRMKGDHLKENARRFLSSAQTFIDKGVIQWSVP